MIARHRGDLRAHSCWRPSAPAAALPAPTEDKDRLRRQPDELLSEHGLDLPLARQRKSRALIALATIVTIAIVAGQQHSAPAPAAPGLPSTPRQWVDQWTAAALQSPAEVCDHLYAPALAHAFTGDTGHSCTGYLNSVFRIRQILQDGAAAAVEAHAVGAGRKWGYFTMLLSHVRGGWQAVDVVPGGSVRAR